MMLPVGNKSSPNAEFVSDPNALSSINLPVFWQTGPEARRRLPHCREDGGVRFPCGARRVAVRPPILPGSHAA